MQADRVLTRETFEERLWIGQRCDGETPSIPAGKARQWLGRELDLLVFDAHCGFDVDAFGALSGTVRGGGLLVLLTPDIQKWQAFDDPEHRRMQVYPESENAVTGRYLNRLAGLIKDEELLSIVTENGTACWQKRTSGVAAVPFADSVLRTEDQRRAVEAIKRVATGHRRRPLVLTANRGRGKSAALGIAAAQLMQDDSSIEKVVITAPSLASAEVVFRHARVLLKGSELRDGHLHWMNRSLCFRAPDELAESGATSDLVLVDEAAAIPAPLLEKFLRKHARIVFASTIHGYEGTGRGFAVRFRKTLDRLTPRWKPLHIREPVRWADNDPLEAFVFKVLMLDAAPVDSDSLDSFSIAHCELTLFDRDRLINDDRLLNEVFGLLVLAHYRTRPFDLRHLLDGPNIEVYGCLHQGRVVATLLAAREGEIDEAMVESIWLGLRRVRGHLIPQSLSNHMGMPESVTLKGLRILRIAVHPSVQRKGVGRLLVEYAADQARSREFDYVGSSFGATVDLVEFWRDGGYVPLRVGLTREASSGCHSLMVLKSLSQAGELLQTEASERFRESLLLQLSDTLVDLEPEIVRLLLQTDRLEQMQVSESDRRDIDSFARGNRLYECCAPALRRQLLLWLCGAEDKASSQPECLSFLIMKILQNRPWSELAKVLGLQGKNQVIAAFRNQFHNK